MQVVVHSSADVGGDARAIPEQAHGPRYIEKRLVDGDPFDQRRHGFEDGVQFGALFHVTVVSAVDEYGLRAQSAGHRRGHGGTDTEHPGLVGAGSHDTPAACTSHNHRASGQGRIVQHLHRGEERIHVYVEYHPINWWNPAPRATGLSLRLWMVREVIHRGATSGTPRRSGPRHSGRHPRLPREPQTWAIQLRRGTGSDGTPPPAPSPRRLSRYPPRRRAPVSPTSARWTPDGRARLRGNTGVALSPGPPRRGPPIR